MKINDNLLDFDYLYDLLRSLKGKTRYQYLSHYINKYKCKNIIEVGVWNGRNSKRMLRAACSNHKANEINYWGFDLWEQMDNDIFENEYSKKPPSKEKINAKLLSTGCNINLIQGDTKKTLKNFYDENKTKLDIDFIYIDGGHSFDTIQSDWDNLKGFMNDKTLTIFDDYYEYTEKDPSTGVLDDLKPTFGCSKLIESLDTNLWNIEILPHFDQFGPRKIFFALVTKKSVMEITK